MWTCLVSDHVCLHIFISFQNFLEYYVPISNSVVYCSFDLYNFSAIFGKIHTFDAHRCTIIEWNAPQPNWSATNEQSVNVSQMDTMILITYPRLMLENAFLDGFQHCTMMTAKHSLLNTIILLVMIMRDLPLQNNLSICSPWFQLNGNGFTICDYK